MPEAQKRPITAEDLYHFNPVSGTRISPDGHSVIYTVHRVDRKIEKKYSNLWIAAADEQTLPRQFTYGDQNDSSPRWSPNGNQIAFLSNRGDKEKPAQIYLIPYSGGEARPLTKIEGSISFFAWSPDGKRLVCMVRKTDAEVLEREKDEQAKKLGTVYRQYDRLFYKLDGYGYLPKERSHLWIIDAETGEGKQITKHAVCDELNPTWSPDGQYIAFVSNRSEAPDMTPDRVDLYIIPADGGTMRKIKTPVGSKSHPSYSPDGKMIAYFAQEGEGLDYRNINVWVVATDGKTAACNLTGAFDVQANGWTINDLTDPESIPPTWTKDGKAIYFGAVFHGSTLIKRVSIDGNDLENFIGEGGAAGSFSFDREQACLAYAYGKIDDPVQVFTRDLASGKVRQLTRQNRNLLENIDLSQVEEVWFKGPDGNDLQGWIMKPPGFRSGQEIPLDYGNTRRSNHPIWQAFHA